MKQTSPTQDNKQIRKKKNPITNLKLKPTYS